MRREKSQIRFRKISEQHKNWGYVPSIFFGLQFYITVMLGQPTIYMHTYPMELSYFSLKAENLSFVYFSSNS